MVTIGKLLKGLRAGGRKCKNSLSRFMHPVTLGDLNTIRPVSDAFGCDRGKAIDRYYIEKFLYKNRRSIKGNVLEVSEDTYSIQFGERGAKTHILQYNDNLDLRNASKSKIVIGDLTRRETLSEKEFDCFICTQTLNFIFDVETAIKNMHFLLQDGGTVLATVAGISQLSMADYDQWGDFYRFTDMAIKKHFERVFGVGNVEVYPYGNLATTMAFLQGYALEDLHDCADIFKKNDHRYAQVIGVKAVKRNSYIRDSLGGVKGI